MWKGIDVSDNQGVIDWAKVKAAGCQFAILRSVLRSGKTDYQFANNLNGCRQQGIPVAVYKYTYATTTEQVQEESCQVVELLKNHNMPESTIVWWDVEDRDTLQSIGSSKLTTLIQTAKTTIEAAGFRFGIYVGFYVYKEKWFEFDKFVTVPLWVARYYNNYNVMQFDANPDQEKKPEVGRALWGWQYTSTGRVPGINGNADLNIFYQDPANAEDIETEPGTIWCLSIADVWNKEIAKAVSEAYPGCIVHKVSVLDMGGTEIWIASVADVWTKAQAEEVQKQLVAIGIDGVVHKVKILE